MCDTDPKHRVRDNLLGIKQRFIYNDLCKDGQSRIYKLKYKAVTDIKGGKHGIIELTEKQTGLQIVKNWIPRLLTESDPTFVITRVSDGLHFFGIYEDELEEESQVKGDYWTKPWGVDTELLITLSADEEAPDYSILYVIIDGKIYRISQFFMKNNILGIDFMPEGDYYGTCDATLYSGIIRKVYRVSDFKELYNSGKCSYLDYEKIETIDIPKTVWTDDRGVVFITSITSDDNIGYYQRKVKSNKDKANIVWYDYNGELKYEGKADVDIGIHRFYSMRQPLSDKLNNQVHIDTQGIVEFE
jgi:hypothetical protein